MAGTFKLGAGGAALIVGGRLVTNLECCCGGEECDTCGACTFCPSQSVSLHVSTSESCPSYPADINRINNDTYVADYVGIIGSGPAAEAIWRSGSELMLDGNVATDVYPVIVRYVCASGLWAWELSWIEGDEVIRWAEYDPFNAATVTDDCCGHTYIGMGLSQGPSVPRCFPEISVAIVLENCP